MVTESFDLPEHWACALFYGDESGMDSEDCAALCAFTQWMLEEYGSCWCVGSVGRVRVSSGGTVRLYDLCGFVCS